MASVTWTGLDELRAQLQRMPAELTGEASGIVTDAAASAKAEIVGIYEQHRVTGNLAKRVTMGPSGGRETQLSGHFGVAIVVKSTAPHAWLFDNGSQARHYITKTGQPHDTGKMWGRTPPTHAFVRTMIKHRRRMYSRLADMLRRSGLIVSGEEAA